MKNQKGVSPLIATVLLLLVCMAVGVIIWQWVTGFQSNVQTESDKTATKMTGCSGATLTVDLTNIKPTWYSAQYATRFVLKNGSTIDLNAFKITAIYSDGNSDLNNVTLNIEDGGQKIAWTKGGVGTGGTKPDGITIESVECGVKTNILKNQIETG
ncbi:MAG: hypothetical protein V1493_05555 [Candidatus Diapherotrites archaeon]